jgi:hypothetical protein
MSKRARERKRSKCQYGMGQFGAGSPSAGVVEVLSRGGTYYGCLTAVTALKKGPEVAVRYCLPNSRKAAGLS